MATRAANVVHNQDKTVTITWSGLLNGDDGAPVSVLGRYADKTVQVTGTPGAGLSVAIEGSNIIPESWGAMNDPQGVVLAIGDAAPVVIAESPRSIRPNVTAGDGTTNVVVTIVAAVKGT